MSEIKVDTSSLNKGEVRELEKFVEEKIAIAFRMKSKMERNSEGKLLFSWDKIVPRAYFRLLLKKFLHKFELKKKYRLISDRKVGFVLRKRKQN